MTAVYCFSGTGHSLAVARFFARRLETEVLSVHDSFLTPETAVVIFPVYCQSLPTPVQQFLRKLDAPYTVLVAVHGKIGSGRVLHEASRQISGTVIAAASVPAGHSFLGEDASFDEEALLPLLDRIAHPTPARIPRTKKLWYASLLPGWRSRMSVRLIRSDACDGCGRCAENCPASAIHHGKPNRKCIRCLRCVTVCPRGALSFRTGVFLQKYLRRHARETETVLYL